MLKKPLPEQTVLEMVTLEGLVPKDHLLRKIAAVIDFDYVLLCALRRIGLAHSQFADATCGTLRLALLKIGAQVTRSVRRIKLAMTSAYPWQHEWALAHARMTAAAA